MQERAKTYPLDAPDPSIELLRRVLRLSAIPTVVVAIVLLAVGTIDIIVFGALLVAAAIEALVVPFALSTQRTAVTIDANGLTVPGRRATVFVPWKDIEMVETRHRTPESTRWLFGLLSVETNRDFAYVGIRADSQTRKERQYLKRFSFYMNDVDQFVRDAEEFRAQSA